MGARIIACDSQDPEHSGSQAIDGDQDTFWHTNWKPGPAPFPHYLTIDFGKILTLKGVTCLPRQDMASCRGRQTAKSTSARIPPTGESPLQR